MSIKFSDSQNLSFGKARTGVTYASKPIVCLGAMFRSIKLVFSFCSPREIFKKAMCGNAIKVAAILAGRGWSNKSQQDKPVDFLIKDLAFFAQAYNWITIMVQLGFQDSLWSCGYGTTEFSIGSNSALVRNLITREIRNRFKIFRGCGKVLVSHASNLLERFLVWLEPGQLRKQSPARSFITQVG